MMETVMGIMDKVYRVFIFNPQTIQVAKEFASGRYEWSWIVLMVGALLLWNVRCWSFFRDERLKTSQTVLRAATEGALHWCLSNAALFCALQLHNAVYGHFTELVPVTEIPDKTSIRKVMVDALVKIHLINQKMNLAPQIRHPQVPFGIMVVASLLVISLAFLVKKPEPSDSDSQAPDTEENVPRHYWN